MDVRYVDSCGRTLLVFNGKKASILDLVKECKEAGVSPSEYSDLLTQRVDREKMDQLLAQYK